MTKILTGFLVALVLVGVAAWNFAGAMMFNEIESPYGVEETAARIQRNIQETPGWVLSGLRNPTRAVQSTGGNVLPTLLVETCNTKYSQPLLKDDNTRILSILMPCTITVYKKNDGKTYIGKMNAGLMGKLFGTKVAEIMDGVAADQEKFLSFDPDKPAPPLVRIQAGGGGKGGGPAGGC
jgi:uncharacterized protein (DUF302 family)